MRLRLPARVRPYYMGADDCMPVINAVAAGFDVGDPTLPRDEDRDVCVYVRRILDERRETHDCFQVTPPAPPPPPPDDGATGSVKRINAYRERLQLGDTATEAAPVAGAVAELQAEEFGAQAGVSALIAHLANENPALSGVLEGAIADLDTAATTTTPAASTASTSSYTASSTPSSSTTTSSSYGRRLFERAVDDDHINLRNAHVASELMREGPLVGVTLAACGALCEALLAP